MNPTILLYALQALQAIPALVSAGISVNNLVQQTQSSLKTMVAENRDPSATEWAEQAQAIHDLRAVLHAA